MTGVARFLALAIVLGVSAGCASRAPIVEPPAETAEQQWERLQERARTGSGHRAFSRLQWQERSGRRVSFDATIVTDSAGTMRLEALSPIGTGVVTLWTDGEDLVFLNHRSNTWWTGRLDEVSSAAPLISALRAIGIRPAANLLFGFPVAGNVSHCTPVLAGTICREVGDIRHELSPAGLLRVTDSAVELTYESPSVPATRVTLDSASGTLSILHKSIEWSTDPVDRPVAPAGWRCCVLPEFE